MRTTFRVKTVKVKDVPKTHVFKCIFLDMCKANLLSFRSSVSEWVKDKQGHWGASVLKNLSITLFLIWFFVCKIFLCWKRFKCCIIFLSLPYIYIYNLPIEWLSYFKFPFIDKTESQKNIWNIAREKNHIFEKKIR